jgi:hypothetical protein
MVAFHLVLFSSAMAVTGLVVRPVLPGGDEPSSRTELKLEHLRAHEGEIDTLFLGSSRAFRGFDPEIFDRLTAAGGHPTRSFNFGVPGSRAMEIHRTLERLAAGELDGLRWVFVDPEGFEVLLEERNYLSRAVIDWHDVDTTLLVCDYILGTGEHGRVNKLRLHAASCAHNLAGVGRGLAWVDDLLGHSPSDADLDTALGLRRDGHLPYPQPQHFRFRKKGIPDYEGRVADLARTELSEGPAEPQPLEMFRRIEARVNELGATAIFVTQPGLYLQEDLIKAAAASEVAHLLRYDDPELDAELFAAENHFDSNHLNSAGAERFTERLAKDFLALAARERDE